MVLATCRKFKTQTSVALLFGDMLYTLQQSLLHRVFNAVHLHYITTLLVLETMSLPTRCEYANKICRIYLNHFYR